MNALPFSKDEIDQWNAYGCGARCLLKLVAIRFKVEIRKEDFVHLYRRRFFVEGKLGGTTTSTLIELAQAMRLCDYADTFRDPKKVIEVLNETPSRLSAVLVLTDLNCEGRSAYHCRLLRGQGHNDWLLWEPLPDGQELDRVPVAQHILDKELPHFLILFQALKREESKS